MNQEMVAVFVGAVAAGLPLIGCIIMVIVEKERWVKLAIKMEERQREVVRWLAEDCKKLGTFTKEGNVIRFNKRVE